jgi:putative transcriptional regulator
VKSKTDWKRVKLLTEREIVTAAKSDADAQPLTTAQLKKFKRVQPTKEVDVRMIRDKLHLSQEQFADYFGVSVRTIQEWEQHRRTPTSNSA